jgi:hypothetical protein
MMDRFSGAMLTLEFLIATYFAIRGDWAWFAIGALGCFVIWAFRTDS